jgi:hypothetical protein
MAKDPTTLKDDKDLIKIRDYINEYGSKNYGMSDNMIGWNQNHGDEKGGTININGGRLMDVAKENITDGSSYGREDDVKSAIDNYASRSGLTSLRVEEEIKKDPVDVTGEFEDSNFEDPYADKIDKYLDTILNREDFEYNHENDDSYKALEKSYDIKGDRAMEDVMGAASQMTGGRTNSWSESTAAQAKGRFDEGLMEKIPALEQAAYQRYMNEGNQDAQALNSLMGVSNNKYNRFADDRNFDRGVEESDRNFDRGVEESDRNFNRGILEGDRNYNRGVKESDRNFNFQSKEAEAAAERWNTEFDYNVTRDQINDANWLKQFDYGKQQDAISNAYQNRQINISEANAASSRASREDSKTSSEVKDYLNYAAQQLESGKTEDEVQEYLEGLNETGDISDEGLREVINRFPSLAMEAEEEPEGNQVSIGFHDMMSADDPLNWLVENAKIYTNSELKELERMLPATMKKFMSEYTN